MIPRFRQRVVSPPFRLGPPHWSVEATFDLDFHLRRMRLPAPGTERTLLDTLQPMASAGFDRARPLWEFTLIEGLYDADGTERAAFAMKVHHAVTDGVGGMALLALLVDLTADADEPTDTPAVPAPETMTTSTLMRDSMVHSSRRLLGVARRTPANAMHATRSTLRDPLQAGVDFGRTARSIARIVAPATAPMSPVMRDRGLGRRLDTFDLSLDDVKRAAKATEGSVNDVFVAAVIGGLHRYHERHGDSPDSLRMTLPINLRREGDDSGGNHFAPARFAVPATIADPRAGAGGPHARAAVARRARVATDRSARRCAEPPAHRHDHCVVRRHAEVLRLRGHQRPRRARTGVRSRCAGERMYAFAPPAGAAVNVSLISHCDNCCIGVVTDTTAVPDASVLLACLREGFDELLACSVNRGSAGRRGSIGVDVDDRDECDPAHVGSKYSDAHGVAAVEGSGVARDRPSRRAGTSRAPL